MKAGTVLSYLAAAVENGYVVDSSRLGISDDVLRTVEQAIDALPPGLSLSLFSSLLC
jgi:hypothetical protein